MHSQPIHIFKMTEEGFSIPEAAETEPWLKVHASHYSFSVALHGVPRKYVRLTATARGLVVIGENALGPSDDFDGWLDGGTARFSSHVGLPDDADTDQVTTVEQGDLLIITVERRASAALRVD